MVSKIIGYLGFSAFKIFFSAIVVTVATDATYNITEYTKSIGGDYGAWGAGALLAEKGLPGGLCPESPGICPPSKYRDATGRCNNVRHPMWGSSGMPFRRIFHPQYADGVSSPVVKFSGELLPSVTSAANAVSNRGQHPYVTEMVGVWGDLLYKDMVATYNTDCTVVSVDQYDFSTIYKMVPEQTSQIMTRVEFYVRGHTDAHIMLRADPDSHDDPNNVRTNRIIAAAIGYDNNVRSAIRIGTVQSYNQTAIVPTPDILSDEEYRGFWVEVYYDQLYVAVGHQSQTEPFTTAEVQASDLPSNKFTRFSIASWESNVASWKINCV